MSEEIKLVVAWMVEGDEDVWPLSYESVKGVADAMVIVDGNADTDDVGLSRYAREGVEVIVDKYDHASKGADGAQRNKYLRYIQNKYPDSWTLVLDADEFVEKPETIKPFIKLLEENNADAASPLMRHLVWNLACEDATTPTHHVPMRLFKVKPNLSYPEVEHNVLQGPSKYINGSTFTLWHLGYAREVMRLRKKYLNHTAKSNIHSETFLTWWYHAHLFGEFPTKPVPREDLPLVLRQYMKVNDDYLYFKDRGVEIKHWDDAQHWVDFFKPKTSLEVGCGLGHRVNALKRMGVDAKGFDISEHAVTHTWYPSLGIYVDDLVKPTKTDTKSDLVIAYDVLEHISEDELDTAIQNIKKWSNRNVLVSIPFEGDPNLYKDGTHKVFRSRDWWIAKFSEHRLAVVPTPEHFNFKHQLLILEKQEEKK